jgi:hypothetical protein
MKRALFVVVVLLVASSARAQLLPISKGVFFSGLALDSVTTAHNLSAGGTELNPMLPNSPGGAVAVSAAIQVVSYWATRKWVEPQSKRLASVVYFISGGVHLGAGTYNAFHWNAADPIARIKVR